MAEFMRKVVFIISLTLIMATILYAKPVSHFEGKIGPYFSSNGCELAINGRFTLNFWVAHVVSELSIGVTASNNTLNVTSFSSNVIRYANFNWKNLKIEYGATSTHSTLFLTTWDVGNIPRGWRNGVEVNNAGNDMAIFWDRGTYDLKYVSPFFFSDFWWYENAMTFTFGLSKGLFYLNGGKYGGSYFVGLGGKYENFEVLLQGFSNEEMVFPNASEQIPSKYVGIFKYDNGSSEAFFAMSENEFYFNSSTKFKLFSANFKTFLSTTYVNTFPQILETNFGMKIEKSFGKNVSLFADFSYEKEMSLWLGMKWRF